MQLTLSVVGNDKKVSFKLFERPGGSWIDYFYGLSQKYLQDNNKSILFFMQVKVPVNTLVIVISLAELPVTSTYKHMDSIYESGHVHNLPEVDVFFSKIHAWDKWER